MSEALALTVALTVALTLLEGAAPAAACDRGADGGQRWGIACGGSSDDCMPHAVGRLMECALMPCGLTQ